MPASVESPAGTAPSVLLIEEYDGLAAAITSALRKFAPQHRTRVVQSLSDAEAAAAETQPQLFIIDLDPPQPKAIEFLSRMCTAHPNARVLAIASGTSPEFFSKRYGPNAVQFVEKPFELADFGAAVQALLGPWTEARSGDSRGTLRDLNLRDLVPLECLNGATAVLKIDAAGEQAGEIHFLDGQICHASASGLSGIFALYEMMRWKNARGSETERAAKAPRTIQGPWLRIFLEAVRKAKPIEEELKSPSPVSLLKEPETAKTQPKSGKKIVVIDDTEMLLIFVEDILCSADPSLQIVTALTGGEGVRRSEVMNPDLVLLDYSMPDLRGDQVCERLLQNEVTARIPVVMMSGHILEMMATAKRYPNVVATIAKPFMSEALVQLVNDTLAKGPLPTTPPKATAIQEVIDPPVNVASLEPRPVRHGNGKKPAKKSALSTSSTREVAEKTIASASTPAIPPPLPAQEKRAELAAARAPDSPTIANLIKVTGKIATAATPPPSSGPATRDIRPAEPALLESPPLTSPRIAKLPGSNGGRVILRLGMEVISVQFTPQFQIGAIRAKPSATTLSLTKLLVPQFAEDRGGAGFELGSVELDSDGRIRTMRVRPTRRPAESIRTRNAFDINDVKLVNEAACIQLTGGSFAPMTMQLLALFKVAAVELSDGFEVAQLVLQPEGSRVRITLDPHTGGSRGMEFETVGVRLDASGRIAEFILSSAAPGSVAA